ncbi:MAG TPA: Fur family transcriptional regulator [Beijerinckiaceae bacterium]|nr:Fur family transcriptional regulator [Beijerinckiaceae bacterium]
MLLRALASGDELGYSQRMARLNADDKPSFLKAHACCDAHHPSAEARLAEAEAVCARKGSRLTAQRRMVLEHLVGAGRALGAYDLISRIEATAGRKLAPITIYRALDFLVEAGLVHRIESHNAFFACPAGHGPHPNAVFMICETCGSVNEAASARIAEELSRLAMRSGFVPQSHIIELTGHCAACSPAQNP